MTQQLNILQSICCMYGYWLLLKISVSDLLFERTKTLTNQLQFDNCHCYYYFEASYFLVWQKTRLCLKLLFLLTHAFAGCNLKLKVFNLNKWEICYMMIIWHFPVCANVWLLCTGGGQCSEKVFK